MQTKCVAMGDTAQYKDGQRLLSVLSISKSPV